MADYSRLTGKTDECLQELLDDLIKNASNDEVRFLAWCIRRHLESKHSSQI